MHKIAIIISHPIQHFCPQYASYAKLPGIKLKVFFASSLGSKPYFDKDFKSEISWSNLYLDQFDHVFLNNEKSLPSSRKLDAPELDYALSEFDPDFVIVNGYFQKYQRRATRWAITHNKKLLYISDSELNQKRPLWKKLLKWPYLFFHFRKIDIFMSVGDSNERYYLSHGVPKEKIVRTCFPIDLINYSSAYNDRLVLNLDIRKKYNISPNDIVLSTVGKLVIWKNQIHVIDALIALESKSKDHRYVYLVAGTGPEMQNMKLRANELQHNKVVFCDFVSPENLPGIYAAADIYIHPAMIEPHSLAISEAIYMGCPVILSDRCGSYGNTDDVKPNENGLVYEWGNIQALMNHIIYLSENTEIRMKFSVQSHLRAVNTQELAHGNALHSIVSNLS